MTNVLLVEDNIEISRLLRSFLTKNYNIILAKNIVDAKSEILKNEIDLILMDLSLPIGNGISSLKDFVNEKSTDKIPIIILSEKEDFNVRINDVSSQADDFLIKPFSSDEILKRIEDLLISFSKPTSMKMKICNLTLDLKQQEVICNVHSKLVNLHLTPIEFKLLLVLSSALEKRFSREKLKDLVWHETNISIRNVDTHICKLRKKLVDASFKINMDRGDGYFLSFDKLHFESVEKDKIEILTLPKSFVNVSQQ